MPESNASASAPQPGEDSSPRDRGTCTVDDFLGIVRILANQTWVRYYLSSFPGEMVLEIANLRRENLSGFQQELLARGFRALPVDSTGDVEILRFAVKRSRPGQSDPLSR